MRKENSDCGTEFLSEDFGMIQLSIILGEGLSNESIIEGIDILWLLMWLTTHQFAT